MDKRLKEKIEFELKNNRLWRVKELLSSAIKNYDYDEELYLEYAKTLYKLGDYMESGKYFLLTNTKEKEYLEATELFLNRHKDNFFDYLPRKFKNLDPKYYPSNIKKVLNPQELDRIYKKYKVDNSSNESYTSKIDEYIGYTVLAFILLLLFLGLLKLIELVISLFS